MMRPYYLQGYALTCVDLPEGTLHKMSALVNGDKYCTYLPSWHMFDRYRNV